MGISQTQRYYIVECVGRLRIRQPHTIIFFRLAARVTRNLDCETIPQKKKIIRQKVNTRSGRVSEMDRRDESEIVGCKSPVGLYGHAAKLLFY